MANSVKLSAGWKELYQTAFLETDPTRIRQRIIEARTAVLDRIEDLLRSSACAENQALNDALKALSALEGRTVGRGPRQSGTRLHRFESISAGHVTQLLVPKVISSSEKFQSDLFRANQAASMNGKGRPHHDTVMSGSEDLSGVTALS